MAGTTFSKFFWQDWTGDDELALCSMGARGVWMGLLVLAARSKVPGHVLIGGKVPSEEELRRAMRCGPEVTDDMIRGWISELLERGVCDKSRDGTIISRRIVRDTKKRAAKSAGGRRSAEVRQGIIGGNSISSNRSAEVPSATSHQPSATSHAPAAQKPPSLEANMAKVGRLGNALGFDPTTSRNGHRFIEQLIGLEMDGYDFDIDILPTIEEHRKAGRIPRDLASLAYFRKPIEAKKQARLVGDAVAAAKAAERSKPVSRAEWAHQLEWFTKDGIWDGRDRFGPSPLEEGCQAPPDMLELTREYWVSHDCLPRNNIAFEITRPTPFWGDNVVPIRKAGG